MSSGTGRARRAPRHDAAAVCAPGLEAVVAAELVALGIEADRPATGLVPFRATTRQLYTANLHLRVANRVLVRLATFPAATFADLERGAAGVPWRRVLPPGASADLTVTSHRSALFHTGAIAERILGVLGVPSARDDGPLPPRFVVRLDRDVVTISVDTSGEQLHRRGWRLDGAKAPLRETLAAAVLLGSGWDRASAVVDPFCGSGTIAIEAALMARRIPAGWQRTFGFQSWPSFEPGTWASVRGEAASAMRPAGSGPPIVGRDRDAGAIDAARANAARAEVSADVDLAVASVSALVPPADCASGDAPGGRGRPGVVATNPPYGRRISADADLRDLYDRTGGVLRERFGGWTVAVLVSDVGLAGRLKLGLTERWRARSGSLPVVLAAGEVRAHR